MLIRLVKSTRKTIINAYLPNNYNHYVSLVLTNQTIFKDIIIKVNNKKNDITSAQQCVVVMIINGSREPKFITFQFKFVWHNKVCSYLWHILCWMGSTNLIFVYFIWIGTIRSISTKWSNKYEQSLQQHSWRTKYHPISFLCRRYRYFYLSGCL